MVGALRLDKIIFPGGYRVLYTNVMYKTVLTNCGWYAVETLSYLIHGRLRRSLHTQKAIVKIIVWEEKCAAGAKKMKYTS